MLGRTTSTNRSKFEIVYEMLESMPRGKTHVMYRANMSSNQLDHYLEEITKCGLAVYKEKIWRRTLQGQRFMDLFDELLKIAGEMTILGKELEENRRGLRKMAGLDLEVKV